MRRTKIPAITTEWTTRGVTQYRLAEPADILGATVANADHDAVYLNNRLGQKFIVNLNGQDRPIVEYRPAASDPTTTIPNGTP